MHTDTRYTFGSSDCKTMRSSEILAARSTLPAPAAASPAPAIGTPKTRCSYPLCIARTPVDSADFFSYEPHLAISLACFRMELSVTRFMWPLPPNLPPNHSESWNFFFGLLQHLSAETCRKHAHGHCPSQAAIKLQKAHRVRVFGEFESARHWQRHWHRLRRHLRKFLYRCGCHLELVWLPSHECGHWLIFGRNG